VIRASTAEVSGESTTHGNTTDIDRPSTPVAVAVQRTIRFPDDEQEPAAN
jgi:hypothetical protein